MADMTLDELVAKFIETKDNQDFAAMMDAMENSTVFVPALPPENISQQDLVAIKMGQKVPVDPKNQPRVCFLKNNEGGNIFPIFTSKVQVPKEKEPKVLMNLPFRAVIALVVNNPEQVTQIVVNPFTMGVVLNEKLIEIADKRFKAQAAQMAAQAQSGNGAKTVQVNEEQFHTIVHTNVARQVLWSKFMKTPQEAVSELRTKKEQMIIDAYKSEYKQGINCPYTVDDVAVMMLQIEENLLITRIDMPEANMVAGGASRVYITCEDSDKVRYFIIEKQGKETESHLAEVTSSGEYEVVGPTPDNGAEIETIMSIIKPS